MTSPTASPDILSIARECGATPHFQSIDGHGWEDGLIFTEAQLTTFAERIRSEQRERDALICEEKAQRHTDSADDEETADLRERCLVYAKHVRRCAAAIREQAAGRTE